MVCDEQGTRFQKETPSQELIQESSPDDVDEKEITENQWKLIVVEI